jgi:multidrug efflux system membrane fusion protein
MAEPMLSDTYKRVLRHRLVASLRLPQRWIWIVAVLVVVAGVAWWALMPGTPAGVRADARNRPLPVSAAPVVKGSLDVYLTALGTATPRNVVTVRSRVDGQLIKVDFREGQLVKSGALLAEIDPRPFEVQLAQAMGQLARDQALLKNAQRDLERYNTLYTQDSISKQQRDTQESLVHQYQGAVESDQGQVDNAKLQLSYCRVTAPSDGRVGLRQVDPGNMVRASDTNGLVVITQLQPITVLFTLSEDKVPSVMKRLQSGETIPVEAYDRDQKAKLASGKLVAIDNQIDTTTGTVKLKAEFPNRDNALFPNQFVNVRLLVDVLRDATLVPTAAIQRGTQGTFVFVVKEDQSVTVRPVKAGPMQGEKTALTEGVAAGEWVVVDGVDKLREGGKVQLIASDGRGADAAAAPRAGDAASGDGPPRGERRRRRAEGGQPGGPQS